MQNYPDQFTELLTLKKTSETLKVHPNTLRQWDKKGILKAVRFGDRKDRHYKKEDVLKLLEGKYPHIELPPEEQTYVVESYNNRKTLAELALDRLSSIQNITSALSRSVTSEEVVSLFISQVLPALGAKSGAIFWLSPGANKLTLLGEVGMSSEYLKEAQSVSAGSRSLYLDVLDSGEPIIIEAYRAVSNLAFGFSSTSGVAQDFSFACLPLNGSNKTLAAMGIYFEKQRTFSKEDIAFMLTLTKECALSLERAMYYEAEKSARAEAELTQSLLHQIYDSSLKFLIPLTTEETYRTIVDEAIKLMGADYGSLFLNIDNSVKKVYTTFPMLYQVSSRPRGYGNTALRTNQILINQVDQNEFHKLLIDLGIQTIVYVPMSYKNKAIGLITLNFLKRRTFEEKDLAVPRLFGSLASLAVERVIAKNSKEK